MLINGSECEPWTFFYAEDTCVALKRDDKGMYFRTVDSLPEQTSGGMYFYRDTEDGHIERIRVNPSQYRITGQIKRNTIANYLEDWTFISDFQGCS